MTAISAMPDILDVVDGDYRSFSIQAGAAITRGMVLTVNSSGMAVPCPIGSGASFNPVIGIAMNNAAIYDKVAVVFEGVVRVANSTSTAALSIGAQASALNSISAYAGAVSSATSATDTMIIGTVLETIAVSSYGRILLKLR